jgi:ketosteroid isomerase-like protein
MAGVWGCTGKRDIPSDATNLLAVDRAFAKISVKKGAAEAFKEYLSKDALQFSAGKPEPVQGLSAIYENMKKAMDSTIVLNWEPQQADVSSAGDMGYTWGYYSVTKKSPDTDSTYSLGAGKYVNVWKKGSDGRWKVKIDIGNSN